MRKPVAMVIGRERELEAASAALGAALEGHGSLLLVTGEQGIGKTTVVSQLASMAQERGASIAWGRSWEEGGAPPYWLWVQVLRELIVSFGAELAPHVSGGREGVIAQVVPELATVTGGPVASSGDRFELFDAVSQMLRSLSRDTSLVLILEDIHSSDEESLLLLDFLARTIGDRSILVVATYSESQAAERIRSVASRLALQAKKVSVRGLAREEVADLYALISGSRAPEGVLDAIHVATEGNPFFVEESIRVVSSAGDLRRPDHSLGFRVPEGVREVVERRLMPLPEDVVKVLTIASVIGREFDVVTLGSVCDSAPEPLLDMLNQATRAKVVHEVGALGRYIFSHILIRETLYESLAAGERMRLHRLVGDVLEDRYRDDLDDHLHEVAHHLFKAAQAGDRAKTLELLVRAAEHSRALTAFEEAHRLYGRALMVAELAGVSSAQRKRLVKSIEEMQRRSEGHRPPDLERLAAEPPPMAFMREGEFWTVTFEGTTSRMKDSKGMRYLRELLRSPGREVHSLELVAAIEGRSAIGSRGRATDELTSSGLGDAGTVLDERAKSEYKRRLEELQEEVEEAEGFNDPERARRAQEEMDALLEQLGSAMGLGGRDRKAASQAERARLSVTKAIRSAIARVEEADPKLGGHLRSTLRTGIYCSYTPDPRTPVNWTT